jgi:3-hydroxyisobutyrate dehydrogenase-like beta-hydroxyacid dehydrogenase
MRLTQAHRQAEQRYVAATVMGRPDMAAAAKLFILAAGDPATVETCMPLFDSLGQKTSNVGPQPCAANLIKLTANFLQAAIIEALGEAVALIGKAGIDRREYIDVLTSTVFTAPAYKIFGSLIAEGKFEPAAFAAPLGYKDIRLALAAAESLRVPMPLANLLHDRFVQLFAQGGERLDWAAIGALAGKDAGETSPT